jgi:hypothetical protein
MSSGFAESTTKARTEHVEKAPTEVEPKIGPREIPYKELYELNTKIAEINKVIDQKVTSDKEEKIRLEKMRRLLGIPAIQRMSVAMVPEYSRVGSGELIAKLVATRQALMEQKEKLKAQLIEGKQKTTVIAWEFNKSVRPVDVQDLLPGHEHCTVWDRDGFGQNFFETEGGRKNLCFSQVDGAKTGLGPYQDDEDAIARLVGGIAAKPYVQKVFIVDSESSLKSQMINKLDRSGMVSEQQKAPQTNNKDAHRFRW